MYTNYNMKSLKINSIFLKIEINHCTKRQKHNKILLHFSHLLLT